VSEPSTTEVRVRRAPKFGAFIAVGALVGFIVTLALTSLFPVDPNVGVGPLVAYFSLFGVSAGVALGALVALLINWRSNKKTVTLEAVREEVAPAPVVALDDTAADGTAADGTPADD